MYEDGHRYLIADMSIRTDSGFYSSMVAYTSELVTFFFLSISLSPLSIFLFLHLLTLFLPLSLSLSHTHTHTHITSART